MSQFGGWSKGKDDGSNEVPRDFLERLFTDSRTLLLIFVILVISWLLSGFYFVQEGEVGVIRRFGKEVNVSSPGLNYRFPWPIEAVDIVNVETIRRAEIGFRSARVYGSRTNRDVSESLMLTGDENIVDAQMIVQYKVRDPSKFLFRLRQPEENLHVAAEVALRSVVGRTTIDDVLTVGRGRVQTETMEFLQQLMDDYDSGIQVTEVKLQVVDPPDQVKDAFHEVVRAREDRERLINQAQGYKEDVIPRARGEAEKKLREAEAYKEERVLKARGDAARFLSLFDEYKNAKQVTRDRLYLETISRILPNAQKVIVDPDAGSTILPLIPALASALPSEEEILAQLAQRQAADSNSQRVPALIRRTNS